MSKLHLTADSSCPPLARGALRLYSMEFCPFAQRARLVLLHKNIPCEVVNIKLRSKPDWFLKKNPEGLVPVIEIDDKIIPESLDCMDYLEDNYPGTLLYSLHTEEKAMAKNKMEKCNYFVANYYGYLFAVEKEVKEEKMAAIKKELQIINDIITGPFMMGDRVSMVDYYMWPWMERIEFLRTNLSTAETDNFNLKDYAMLDSWHKSMTADPAAQQTLISLENHMGFAVPYFGRQPDFDFDFMFK